jgi:tRNA 2-thiouridine synthesizing protein A
MPDQVPPPHDADWDAADLGCGDLVLRLRFRLKAMQVGEVIRVRALDPGAVLDLPAWCRLTGETLLHTDPQAQLYYIRREGR